MSGFADRIDAARATGPGNSGTPVASCAGPSCTQLWAAIHAERDRTLAIADPIARNRQISAQYARLYQSNHNLQWVGLASVVSRQAGCAMVKADTARQSWIPMKSGPADSAYRALGEANGSIYGDIYPVAKFYQQHGLARLRQCGTAANGQAVDPQLMRAFQQIDAGTPESVRRGSDLIANYEQRDIIQDQVYAREEYRDAFEANEWWARRPLGRWMGAERPELPISSQCTEEGKVPFSGSILDPNARVGYYGQLMDGFNGMTQAQRDALASDIIRQAR